MLACLVLYCILIGGPGWQGLFLGAQRVRGRVGDGSGRPDRHRTTVSDWGPGLVASILSLYFLPRD